MDQNKLASKVHLVFSTNEGREVMEHLEFITHGSILSGNVMMDIQGEISPENCAMIREGQNQVIRYFKNLMRYYEDNK